MNALREHVRHLSQQPGVYLWKDGTGNVLYVGKARALKARVAQYLTRPTRLDPPKRALMTQAADIETLVTKNEAEALALEAALIQRHQPPYNVRLVDDSSYLYVKITKETYPNVQLVRRVATDGAWYRGPFPVASAIRRTLREARKLFPWCEYGGQTIGPRARATGRGTAGEPGAEGELTKAHGPKPMAPAQLKTCFAYHLGLCPGICAGKISLEEYQRTIEGLKRFLDGDTTHAVRSLRARRDEASAREDYERAATLRDTIRAIENATTPQHLVTTRRESVDALGLASRSTHAVVAVLSVREGRATGVRVFPLLVPSDERPAEILRSFLLAYLPRATDGARDLLLPETVADAALLQRAGVQASKPLRFIVPRRGWKRQLLEASRANAEEAFRRAAAELTSGPALQTALRELAGALRLERPPHRVEAYDISNIQGTLPTGSMVVFVEGKPKRSDYRKFRVVSKETPDDVAMMTEVLRRRFGRHAKAQVLRPKPQEWPLPDLVIVDGGKAQLGAGTRVLKELDLGIPIAALAKREEELFVPGRTLPLVLPRASPALFLLQRLRDEAHRFTRSYHRLLRKKRATRSLLEEIPGVGDATRKNLLRAFGSVRAIRTTSREDLAKVVSPKLAETIKQLLQ